MKKISTLFLTLAVLLTLPLTASAEDFVFDFQNNTLNLTVGEGASFADGALTAPVTVGEVTLTSIQGGASYPAIMMKDNQEVISLNVYKNGAVKLAAAEGKAVTKIVATMKSKTFSQMAASSGTTTENVWEGNASEVTFTASALMSLWKLEVTTAAENEETVKPAVGAFDIEAADIASFNAAEDGKAVKLTLKDARVNGSFNSSYYVEDATGAFVIKGVTLTVGTLLNGYIIGTKGTDSSIDYMNDPATAVEYQLTATDVSNFEATETTLKGTVTAITEACSQANYGKLITIENVTVSGSGRNKTLTDAGGNTLTARDYMGVLPNDYIWPETAKSITGVLIYYMTGWFLMPISAEAIVIPVAGETEALFDFANNNLGLTAGSGGASDPAEQANAGNLGGKKLVQGDVTMTFTNPATMPIRYFYLASRTNNHLQMAVKDAKLRLTAADGRAITKIVVEQNALATKPNDNNVKWEVDKGEGSWDADTKTWTGNATSVRFSATAATYINSITVTTAPASESTVTPSADEYTAEVNTLAAFNALADGTLAKLTLTNAVVVSKTVNEWGFWLQDATAGAHFYCTGLLYNAGDVLNGSVIVKKVANGAGNPGNRIAMAEATSGDLLTVSSDGSYAVVSGNVDDINKAENIGNVVQLTGVSVKGSAETTATITDAAGKTITIENSKVNYAPYSYKQDLSSMDISGATVTGILYYSNFTKGEIKIYPLSITTATGIADVTKGFCNSQTVIYNLQGVRRSRLTKGLNIVNCHKFIVR
jgi:hypothetical protein